MRPAWLRLHFNIAFAGFLLDELVGVPSRCCLVRERLHIALALRADAAELHVDLDTIDRDLPELVGIRFRELEPAPACCRWRVHGYLFFLGYEGGLHILANTNIGREARHAAVR